jgi:hypothetical protein
MVPFYDEPPRHISWEVYGDPSDNGENIRIDIFYALR